MSPGAFAAEVRRAVERGAKVIVIDSLNGYLHAMPAEKYLYTQLHELLTYFGQCGATTIMLMAQAGIIGSTDSPADVSYIADSVMLLRYFEAAGHVRKALSVIKKRTGAHESTIRELTFKGGSLSVGQELSEFRGVLTSVPEYFGDKGHLR
jgi:circadian clock protein KaiC